MKKYKLLCFILCLSLMLSLCACAKNNDTQVNNDTGKNIITEVNKEIETVIEKEESSNNTEVKENGNIGELILLNGDSGIYNGIDIEEFDYVFNISPDMESPTYTGQEPSEDLSVYIAHDIIYYPQIDVSEFTKETYDDEVEWVTHYTVEGLTDYLFGTLPVLGSELPADMMHSAEEAYSNPVLHITRAGTYRLQGIWNGQINIDLGDEASTDETQKVVLILDNVDVTCEVAPAIVFKNVYEADTSWKEEKSHSSDINIDESNSGAVVIIADNSENNIVGQNVYRLLKAQYKKEGSTVQKKYYKTDGAFYSYMSMVVEGEEENSGILNITSTTFEGLDTELHLVIDGGNINIYSQDDGINVNEDNVSVFMMNSGTLHIFAGLGAEGDGIDSNGYIVVNGGLLYSVASPISDNGLDSEDGTIINGGTVVALGSNMGGNSYYVYLNGQEQYTNREGYNQFGGGMPQWGGDRPGGQGGFNGETPPDFNGETPPEPPEGLGGERPEMPENPENPNSNNG